MSLDVSGFTEAVEGGEVIIKVNTNHRLLKLARNLPWETMRLINYSVVTEYLKNGMCQTIQK